VNFLETMKTHAFLLSLAGLVLASAPSARAAFHLFDIQEAYSNGDGSVQFIELFSAVARRKRA
jgi:hypothetical protein